MFRVLTTYFEYSWNIRRSSGSFCDVFQEIYFLNNNIWNFNIWGFVEYTGYYENFLPVSSSVNFGHLEWPPQLQLIRHIPMRSIKTTLEIIHIRFGYLISKFFLKEFSSSFI